MRSPFCRAFLWLLLLLCPSLPAQVTLVSPDMVKTEGDMLPNDFAGWRADRVERFSLADLPKFAGQDAEVLREYGFLAAERKEFTRASPSETGLVVREHVTIEALRMHDASGAYGVFTYYRQPTWRAEEGRFYAAVGPDQAVLMRNSYCLRILGGPAKGAVRLDGAGTLPNAGGTAGPMTRDQLAVLASSLPTFREEPLPSLREFVPEKDVVRNSLQYVLGPQVFSRLAPQIPSHVLGFDLGAEAELARYRVPGKPQMTLLLVLYPTPQMAAAKLRDFARLPQSPLQFRRTGSLISFVLDAPSKTDADLLLDRVHYKMEVVWNQPVPKRFERSLAQLILNIFLLAGILLAFALVSGLLFGGLRVFTKRFFPGHVFDRDVEIIRLNLSR